MSRSRIRENSDGIRVQHPNSQESGYMTINVAGAKNKFAASQHSWNTFTGLSLLNSQQVPQVRSRRRPESGFERHTDTDIAFAEIKAKAEMQDPVQADS